MIFLGGLGGFFTDFFSPLKEKVSKTLNPPAYWECEQDRNIRGIILPYSQTISADSIINIQFGLHTPIVGEMDRLRIKDSNNGCFLPIYKGVCALAYRIDDHARLLLTADIYDSDESLAGKIVENQFVLNKGCQFTWNMDDYGFEVVGRDFEVIFSIDFRPPKTLAIQGAFREPDCFVVVNDMSMNWYFDGDVETADTLKRELRMLKPIFEYLGKDWFGKRKVY